MTQSAPNSGRAFFVGSAVWTFAGFAASIAFKLGSNVVLSRLLVPEILGIMVVVNSIKIGIELLTDMGIEQNIVHNEKGYEADFFNTSWTLQIIRGGFLTALFLLLSKPLSLLYGIDARVFMIISFAPFLNSLHSTAIFLLVKGLDVRKRNLFEFFADMATFLCYVISALISPTVWALLIGTLIAIVLRSAFSYFLPRPAHRIILRWPYVSEIFDFGKWIMVSSLVVYAAANIDRITLGKLAPLGLLGIYGLARTIAELPPNLALRLGYQIIFPALTAGRQSGRMLVTEEVKLARWHLVLLASLAIGTAVAWADWAVRFLYDARYWQASWMLFLLLFGSWLSILSSLNEAVIIAASRPYYISIGHGTRLAVLAAGLIVGYMRWGFLGAIVAIIVAEGFRYAALAVGQARIQLSFWRQDVCATLIVISTFAMWVEARHALGLDVPWSGMTFQTALAQK